MSSFHAFNCELFSTKVEDYTPESAPIVKESNIYKGTFGPLQVPIAIRLVTMEESEVELYENELHLDRVTEHPNLIKMLCHFLHGERTWYSIFPYSPHKSMAQLCQPTGLSEPVIAFAVADILKALDYLHHNNIIHRLSNLIQDSW